MPDGQLRLRPVPGTLTGVSRSEAQRSDPRCLKRVAAADGDRALTERRQLRVQIEAARQGRQDPAGDLVVVLVGAARLGAAEAPEDGAAEGAYGDVRAERV